MAFQGPAYGLSRECLIKAQAKFDLTRAMEAITWIEDIVGEEINPPRSDLGWKDQLDFANALKNGQYLCKLINVLLPGAVSKINTMNAPFKQRENIEMFLKGCEKYGLKSQDLFQVNDLFEHKNVYMVVDCIHALGGMAQRNHFTGPKIGVKVADINKRDFTEEQLAERHKIIGLQYGSNKGATQRGMTAYGTGRQIIPDGK